MVYFVVLQVKGIKFKVDRSAQVKPIIGDSIKERDGMAY